MRDLQETRLALDAVDRQIVALFEQRMTLARDVAEYKIARGMPVLDRSREEQVLESRCAMLADGYWAPAVRELYEQIMALSRLEQQKMVEEAEHA
ncbi:MAG: chorismate mutase [Clostridia bacterium]|nr:chorismate mutase [Clostridia bacterium]